MTSRRTIDSIVLLLISCDLLIKNTSKKHYATIAHFTLESTS